MAGVFADGAADDGGQGGLDVFRLPLAVQGVHHAFGGECAFGKAGALQIVAWATLHAFKHGVANQIITAVFAVHQEVVGVEVEAHLRREIGQPENGGLQSCEFACGQRVVERGFAFFGAGEFLHAEFQPEHPAGAFDDAARRAAVGNQRHAVKFDNGQPHEGERMGDAENEGFVERVAAVVEQGGHHAAFAMGGVLVGEIGHKGSRRFQAA
ncbi:hypothetical protein GCWU000324_02594 [Kingella oralis ATCC 51147]|uniref:Uncharacterized protein n=1 Tax=Kingella oralis ATCC 51147 TaxID=629741 RepID=C4GLM3_9NEIS|nr:hypothetical protein GCWU000324_02594 [Kingella oralis ATCC 51147]